MRTTQIGGGEIVLFSFLFAHRSASELCFFKKLYLAGAFCVDKMKQMSKKERKKKVKLIVQTP